MGLSTAVAMFFLHRILFRANTHAIMASAQVGQSEKLSKMIDTALDRIPFWLQPAKISTRAKEPTWENGSALSIQAGSQTVGIAQGSTPSCIHLCLSPETLIHLEHGKIKPISEVVPGDKVITSKAQLKTVRAVAKSPRGKEVACELALWGNYSPLIVTRDHPILTPDGFIAAESLEKGDLVSIPVRPITNSVRTAYLEHRPTGYYGHKKTRKIEKECFVLNRDWGWLCGLYLSEGSAHRNTRISGKPVDAVYFSIHQKEKERTLAGMRGALGMFRKLRYDESKRSLSANVCVSNAGLARWLTQEFGIGAAGKKIPDWVFQAGKDFVEGLVQGYFEGDGHISPRVTEVIAHSISMSLLIQMRDLLASLGIGWSSLYFRPAGYHYGRNCQAEWALSVNSDASRIMRSRFGWPQISKSNPDRIARARKWSYSPDGRFVRIQVFENRPNTCGSFYDLEVNATEHDFCTIHCCVKNSELADYDNPVKTIEEGIFPAAHYTPALFFVMEGTGSTASPWQKEKWNEYKTNWGKGGRFRTLFIPPACASDIYPTQDWLRGNPIPESWNPPVEVLRMKRRCELFVRSTDYLEKYLGASWEMPIEYMWFWWLGWRDAMQSHSEKTFLAMNAVTDVDAFQSKFDPVFSDETITLVTTERERNYKPYAVTGRTIIVGRDNKPYMPPEHEIDYSAERIPLRWEANDGNVYTWELIPLKPFDDSTDEACFNKLLVFKEPQDGKNWSEGIDTAQGLSLPNEDRSSCTVLCNEYGRERDTQAASFTSLDVNPAQMSRISAAIAVYYTTDGSGELTCANPMGMRFIIEQIRKSGDECLNQLKLMGFYNHHVMHFYDDKGTINPDKGRKEGWRTVEWSRDILLSKFVNYVNMGWFKPNDPILIRQLKTFIRRKSGEDKAKMIHEVGQHDDNIFSNAMALLTAHDIEIEASRITKCYSPAKDDAQVSTDWCDGSVTIDEN